MGRKMNETESDVKRERDFWAEDSFAERRAGRMPALPRLADD
jgi:hypothetical protein